MQPPAFDSYKKKKVDAGAWRSVSVSPEIEFERNLATNDYLGLSNDSVFKQELHDVSRKHSVSAHASRLLSGQKVEHRNLENEFAKWKEAPASLAFVSGYAANLGIFRTFRILFPEAVIFSDERNHASLIDGIKLSGLRVEIFKHNDHAHLASLLGSSNAAIKIVVVESLYSMQGDICSSEILELADDRADFLVADEAHSIGLFGKKGQGLIPQKDNRIIGFPCGKALGVQGGIVTCPTWFKEAMVQEARSFVYSTGISPWLAVAIYKSVLYLQKLEERRSFFTKKVEDIFGAFSPIWSLPVIGNQSVIDAADAWRKNGWLVYPIRYPTVPLGKEMLRLSLHPFVNFEALKRQLCLHQEQFGSF